MRGYIIVLLFAVYYAVRGIASYWVTTGGQPYRERQVAGGRVILAFLWVVYLALLFLAIRTGWKEWGFMQWCGCGVVTLGTVLRIMALRSLGGLYVPTIALFADHSLVKSGPYAVLRHPLYLGLNVEAVGLAVISSNLMGYTMALVSIFSTQVQNRCEEYCLSRRLGTEYEDYIRRTWDLDKIWPMRMISRWLAGKALAGLERDSVS